jgi:membrane protein
MARASHTRARQLLERAWIVGRAVLREARAENLTFLAGSIAYHAFVSLLPFLLLLLFVISRAGDERTALAVMEAVAGYLTAAETETLVDAARQATANTGLSLAGVALLVWGALRIFRGLDTAFSTIYETQAANTFLDTVVDSVVVFLTVGVAIVVVATVDAVVGVPVAGPVGSVLAPVVTALGVALALLPMYYVFPDEDVTVREILPGTLVAAVGWTVLGRLFKTYAAYSSRSEYGIIGVVALLVTWLYFIGLVLLLGAAINAVVGGRTEDVDDIAWEKPPGGDPGANDEEFVEPLCELRPVLDERGDVEIAVGDRSATVPEPHKSRVTVKTVERPSLLGGDRERGEVVLTWDSREG